MRNKNIIALCFHRVLSLDSDDFNQQMYRYDDFYFFKNLLETLSKKNNFIKSTCIKKRITEYANSNGLCLTFDDGYFDFYTNIYPILAELNIPATVFINTAGVINGYLWDDEIRWCIHNTKRSEITIFGLKYSVFDVSSKINSALEIIKKIRNFNHLLRTEYTQKIREICDVYTDCPRLFMNTEQLLELNPEIITIGCHTHDHVTLATESKDFAFEQILKSKEYLENTLKRPVDSFAFPNGKYLHDYSDTHIDMLKEMKFSQAFSTNYGKIMKDSDFLNLPRFTPWDKVILLFRFRLWLHQNVL
jgi:peptidoglycan/xylan/chitin deacetylase (PgdA/CDA1 family)